MRLSPRYVTLREAEPKAVMEGVVRTDADRPAWARRLRAEREARGWTQQDAVGALRRHAAEELPGDASLLRTWKSWEAGDHLPSGFYRAIIARAFGTVTAAFFPPADATRRDGNGELLLASGMDTLDLLNRLQGSRVDQASLEALRVTVDRLCSEYPYLPSAELLSEGREWLRRVGALLEQRMTLGQHREVLVIAGWLALLVGCVEFDMGQRRSGESTRAAALSLGSEAGSLEIVAWAHEMRAWSALTRGDHRGVVAAAQEGSDAARGYGVAVQLAAQEAKAWARMGERHRMEVALERGRRALESLEPPANLDNHFVVDPSKYDFYVMDCRRVIGDDGLAVTYADEVIRAGTDLDGQERMPMRIAEARVTHALVAARRGDVEQAASHGRASLASERASLPSLLMVSRELARILGDHHGDDPGVRDYLDELRTMSLGAPR